LLTNATATPGAILFQAMTEQAKDLSETATKALIPPRMRGVRVVGGPPFFAKD
jgi:hypothetical protein